MEIKDDNNWIQIIVACVIFMVGVILVGGILLSPIPFKQIDNTVTINQTYQVYNKEIVTKEVPVQLPPPNMECISITKGATQEKSMHCTQIKQK